MKKKGVKTNDSAHFIRIDLIVAVVWKQKRINVFHGIWERIFLAVVRWEVDLLVWKWIAGKRRAKEMEGKKLSIYLKYHRESV